MAGTKIRELIDPDHPLILNSTQRELEWVKTISLRPKKGGLRVGLTQVEGGPDHGADGSLMDKRRECRRDPGG